MLLRLRDVHALQGWPGHDTKGTEAGAARRVVSDVSVDDYLLEGVSEFDAHTRLMASGKCCVYPCTRSDFSFFSTRLDVGQLVAT